MAWVVEGVLVVGEITASGVGAAGVTAAGDVAGAGVAAGDVAGVGVAGVDVDCTCGALAGAAGVVVVSAKIGVFNRVNIAV